jgi:succinate dehydrogenase / fumarate reductase, iron-sulfur subunit
MNKNYILKIFRGHPGNQYWEEFELELEPMANVISSLMQIQKNPVNREGKKVEPIVWESGCLEEVCGSCSMLVNGFPRQACTALIEPLMNQTQSNVIKLAPLTKFPLVRDLIVDRTVMFENLKKIHGWIESDGAYDRGPGPNISPEVQEVMYSLSTCMTCGCCSEACPQINPHSKFLGPATVSQVRYFNIHPVGKMQKHVRMNPMLEEGGIGNCGNAQNCVRVCPKKIPLTDSIADISRAATIEAFHRIFGLPGKE